MLCTGAVVEMAAGDTIPNTDVVVLSGAGQKLSRALLGGQKQQLKVVQQLYYLGPQPPAAAAAPAAEGEPEALEGGGCTAAAADALAAMAEVQPTGAAAKGAQRQRLAGSRPPCSPGTCEDASQVLPVLPGPRSCVPSCAALTPAGGKGRGKRRQRGAAAAAADKENQEAAEQQEQEQQQQQEQTEQQPAGKKGRRGRQSGGAPAATAAVPQGELVLAVENKTPIHDVFQFQKVTGGLARAGSYQLWCAAQAAGAAVAGPASC